VLDLGLAAAAAISRLALQRVDVAGVHGAVESDSRDEVRVVPKRRTREEQEKRFKARTERQDEVAVCKQAAYVKAACMCACARAPQMR